MRDPAEIEMAAERYDELIGYMAKFREWMMNDMGRDNPLWEAWLGAVCSEPVEILGLAEAYICQLQKKPCQYDGYSYGDDLPAWARK